MEEIIEEEQVLNVMSKQMQRKPLHQQDVVVVEQILIMEI